MNITLYHLMSNQSRSSLTLNDTTDCTDAHWFPNQSSTNTEMMSILREQKLDHQEQIINVRQEIVKLHQEILALKEIILNFGMSLNVTKKKKRRSSMLKI